MDNVLVLSLEELADLFVTFIPIGFLVGCFPMLIGFTIQGLMHIFKRA